MNVRSALVAVLAAALAGPAVPAHSDPFVGRAGWVSGNVPLRGTDGRRYDVTFTVRALSPAGGTPTYQLQAAIAQCSSGSCTVRKTYARPLTASEVTADEELTSVTARVKLLGTSAVIAWNASTDPDAVPKVLVEASTVRFSLQPAEPSNISVTAWGVRCTGAGTYYKPYAVSVDGFEPMPGARPTNATPREFAKRGKARVKCAY